LFVIFVQGYRLAGQAYRRGSLVADQRNIRNLCCPSKSFIFQFIVQVNARGEKEFTPVYPAMLSLGPELLKNFT
jgi:hypothetical protein